MAEALAMLESLPAPSRRVTPLENETLDSLYPQFSSRCQTRVLADMWERLTGVRRTVASLAAIAQRRGLGRRAEA